MKILIEIFYQKVIVSDVTSVFVDHLKHKNRVKEKIKWLVAEGLDVQIEQTIILI